MNEPGNETARRWKVAASLAVVVGAVTATAVAKGLLLGGALAAAAVGSACGPQATPAETTQPAAPSPVPGKVSDVSVTPTSVIVFPNDTVPFVAAVNADPSVTNRTVTWASGSQGVATIDSAGTLTAVAAGATTITARSNADSSVSGTASVIVVDANSSIIYNINATKVTDTGCNFAPSFSGQLFASGIDSSRVTLRLIERLTRTYASRLRPDGSFDGTSSGSFSGFPYNSTITGKATGNSVQGRESFIFPNGCAAKPVPGQQVVYDLDGNR